MTRRKYFFFRRDWLILFSIAALFVVLPCKMNAQSSGPNVDECTSVVVDSSNDIEEEVCLYGNESGLSAYVEVDNDGEDGFVAGVDAAESLYKGSTLVYNSGDSQSSGNASVYYSLVPQIAATYTLNSLYGECYDYSWSNDYGDCDWSGDQSGPTVSVQITPSVNLATSNPSTASGASVTFTASIDGGLTGTITFYDGGTSIGTGTISGSAATLTTNSLAVGYHTITAYWPGNSSYSALTSSVVNQTVYQPGPMQLPAAGIIGTVAGNGVESFAGDGGAAMAAELYIPVGVAIDSSGNLYIADPNSSRVRKVTASTGVITTVAGNGTAGYSGDGGAATSAELNSPYSVAVDASGNIYIADQGNQRIRKVTVSTGVISTIAGTGTAGYSGEGGAATSAKLQYPNGVALDSSGNIYISDLNNNRIRKITVSTGIIATIAGNGTDGYSGDGGAATSAELGLAYGWGGGGFVALDSSGNIYIADQGNHRIRKVTASTGVITTVAGNGTSGFSGDGGAATSAEMTAPTGVVLDSSNNIYFSDFNNCRVRKVTASTGVISTVAGGAGGSYSGDGGAAASAGLDLPADVAVDASGNLYIADAYNNRIRAVGSSSKQTPTLSVTTSGNPSTYSGSVTFTATISSGPTGTITFYDGVTSIGTGTISGTTATYSTASLAGGTHTISASWAGNSNYNPVTSNSFTQTVNKATPSISWSNPAAIASGTALSSTQLDASFSVAGTCVYSPGTGTILSPGTQSLSTTCTPTNTVDYNTVTGSVSIVVNGVSDTGTVKLLINGNEVATTTYGYGSTPSSVAAGLAAALSSTAPVTVIVTDDTLYIESKIANFSSNYITYGVDNREHNLAFSQASFSLSPISGNLQGGATSGSGSPTTVYSYSRSYDVASNLLSTADSVMGTWSYQYDPLNRLASAQDTSASSLSQQFTNNYFCWNYDSFGNRNFESLTSTNCTGSLTPVFSASYNANNQMASTTQYANQGSGYDQAGNITKDGVNTYLYDADGKLCAVKNEPISGTYTMTGYLYDADGTRVAKGSIASMSCDPNTNGFQTTNDYILGPSGQQVTEMGVDSNNSLVWQHTNAWAGGMLLATYDPDTLHFYFNDALGTRRVQADYQGVVEEDCASLPFGDEESCLPTPSEHLFTGKERDAESGNDYFGARYYSSAMGRFMSPDWAAKAMPVPYAVMGDPQSLNLYAYVRNNPLSRRDLDGHCAPNTSNPGGWVCMNPRWGIAAPQQQSGFGGAGAGGSWDPAPTQSTTTASSTPSRVKIPGYGGTATVAAGAAPFIPTESPEIGASIPEIPYVNTPFGPAYQGGSEAELGALADAQGGAMLYRSGITGFNSATEGQYWSMMNPTTTEGYTDLMGMPSQVGAEGYPFIVSARLAPGAAAITRFAPAVAGGGTGGALEVVVGDAAEALEVLAFTIP